MFYAATLLVIVAVGCANSQSTSAANKPSERGLLDGFGGMLGLGGGGLGGFGGAQPYSPYSSSLYGAQAVGYNQQSLYGQQALSGYPGGFGGQQFGGPQYGAGLGGLGSYGTQGAFGAYPGIGLGGASYGQQGFGGGGLYGSQGFGGYPSFGTAGSLPSYGASSLSYPGGIYGQQQSPYGGLYSSQQSIYGQGSLNPYGYGSQQRPYRSSSDSTSNSGNERR